MVTTNRYTVEVLSGLPITVFVSFEGSKEALIDEKNPLYVDRHIKCEFCGSYYCEFECEKSIKAHSECTVEKAAEMMENVFRRITYNAALDGFGFTIVHLAASGLVDISTKEFRKFCEAAFSFIDDHHGID